MRDRFRTNGSDFFRKHRYSRIIGLLVSLLLLMNYPLRSETKYLSEQKAALICIASLSVGIIGLAAADFDSSRSSLFHGPFPGEKSLLRSLGGKYYPGKSNWLDDMPGALVTPAAFGLILAAADLAWPSDNGPKETAQDLFLFISGMAATQGLADISKGIFARPRPYLTIPDEIPSPSASKGYAYDHASFFSSHTSNAFFGAAYLNKRLRRIMKHEMNGDDYKSWRWVPPVILFGWASYVGWSRISSYNHYPSDVIIGAAAGWLMAELYFSFGDNSKNVAQSSLIQRQIFRVGFSF